MKARPTFHFRYFLQKLSTKIVVLFSLFLRNINNFSNDCYDFF